jgi:glycosyltransferase involved in cell wall biosynthesis
MESKSSPRFSVIIPAYNAEITLARAIQSVLDQSFHACEVIVVDDGSGDGTGQVAQSFGSSVRYIRQDNAGPSTARNHGVEVATGDWIAFLDADDWYYPSRLESHAELIRKNPGLDFVVSSFDYVDICGDLIRNSMIDTRLGKKLIGTHGNNGTAIIEAEQIGGYIMEQFSDTRTLSLPRSKFIELDGFSAELRICEDVVFLLRMCSKSSRAGVVCAPGAVYLVHDQGLIRSNRLRAQTETIRALMTLKNEMAVSPPHILESWRFLVKESYNNLGYFLAKNGRRIEAVMSIFRSMFFSPKFNDVRVIASILRG